MLKVFSLAPGQTGSEYQFDLGEGALTFAAAANDARRRGQLSCAGMASTNSARLLYPEYRPKLLAEMFRLMPGKGRKTSLRDRANI
jgi:hypothetical protein